MKPSSVILMSAAKKNLPPPRREISRFHAGLATESELRFTQNDVA